MTRSAASAGFSLVELLAALAIFAVLAVMTQQALVATLMTQTRASVRRADLASLQRAVTLVGRDLENVAPRGVRGANGAREPFLILENGGETLTFTRGGLPNPAGLRRSGFQRIRYVLGRDGRGLERWVWPRLDPVAGQRPQVEVLYKDIEGVRFRVWTERSRWRTRWPNPEDLNTRMRLPEGIEAILDTSRFGTIRRLVSLK